MAAPKGQRGNHAYFAATATLHQSVGSFAGGACLSGHQSRWKMGDSCSYRWQGLQKAEENPDTYNSHSKPYCHLHGEGFPFLATLGIKNFHNGFMPYTNQVHHVLPNSALRKGIDEATRSNANLVQVICDGLLAEKYNINFKDNMIILAVQWRHACQIGLPTHLGDHPDYTKRIQDRVIDAVLPYAQMADEGEDHDIPPFKDLKDDLENISRAMYDSIVAFGQHNIRSRCAASGVSVNQLPDRVFAVL